jgi:hypothetical protein
MRRTSSASRASSRASDALAHWVSDQRLHQYRGGQSETYNGVSINIDNDCADGLVVPHGHDTGGDPACTT